MMKNKLKKYIIILICGILLGFILSVVTATQERKNNNILSLLYAQEQLENSNEQIIQTQTNLQSVQSDLLLIKDEIKTLEKDLEKTFVLMKKLKHKMDYIRSINPKISEQQAWEIVKSIQIEIIKYPYLDFDTVFAQCQQESTFDPNAIGKDGDSGLMQIMPNTGGDIARKLGYKNYDPSILFDIKTNIKFGVFYLHEKYIEASKIAKNEETIMRLALVSYNAGKGNSLPHYKRYGNYYNDYHEKVLKHLVFINKDI